MTELVLAVLAQRSEAAHLLNGAKRLATLMGGAHIHALAIGEPIHVAALGAEALIDEA